MLALLFTAFLFFFWMIVGSAALRLSRFNFSPSTLLLLAPSCGVSLLLLIIFNLSRFGLSVSQFCLPLFGAAFLFSLTSFFYPREHHRGLFWDLVPFSPFFLLALVLSSWPFLLYQADWLSFANNDMANYSLLAQRFLEHSFFQVPSPEELFSGAHYEQTYWLQGLVERPGSELLLSWISGIVAKPTTKCFMPFILSLHLCIISGAAGLVYEVSQNRKALFLTLFFLALSPLLTFGALYQLLGQTAGLCILLGASLVFAYGSSPAGRKELFKVSLLFSLLLSAQMLVYPELLPFLGLSVLAWWLRFLVSERRWPEFAEVVMVITPPLALLPIILRSYLVAALGFLLRQTHSGVTGYKQAADVFSQYLSLSGLAGLWGFFNIYSPVGEPYLSAGIVIAAGLLILLTTHSLKRLFRGDFLACIFLLMLGVGGFLSLKASAFGLYKMAMYLQPFLWGSMALFFSSSKARLRIGSIFAPVLVAILLKTQYDYVASSRGEADRMNGTFCEIYKGSSTKILSELQELSILLQGRTLVSDSSNLVLAKLQSSAFVGKKLSLPFFDLFPTKTRHLNILQAPELNVTETVLHKAEKGRIMHAFFDMRRTDTEHARNKFWVENNTQPEDGVAGPFSLIINTALQTPFNRRLYGESLKNFHHLPWEEVRNHLVFVDSEFGRLYYSHDRDRIALYQLEPDYFYPGKTMAGIGRNFVFQAIHPSAKVRMQIWMTASLKHDGNNLLPQAQAIGQTRVDLPFVGRGSGRVFSAPLDPQQFQGRFYLGLDMGVDGNRWNEERTGILRFFESSRPADPRKLTGFLRDISLVSDEEYQSRKCPSALQKFPDDLRNENLEYSGIYEDGWLSEESFVSFGLPSGASKAEKPLFLRFQGSIPNLSEESSKRDLRIFVDNTEIWSQHMEPGSFDIRIPLSEGVEQRSITLKFSGGEPLPGGDSRPISAKIEFLGIERGETA